MKLSYRLEVPKKNGKSVQRLDVAVHPCKGVDLQRDPINCMSPPKKDNVLSIVPSIT